MRRQDDVSLLDAGDEVERMGKYKGGEETASCAVPCLEEPMPKMGVVSSSSTLKKGGEALSGDTRVAPVVFQGFSQVDGKTGATDPGLDLGSLPTQDSRTDLCKKAESVCGEEGRRIFDLGPKLFQGLLEVLPLCSLSMWKGDNSLFPLPTSRSTLRMVCPRLDDEVFCSWVSAMLVSLNSLWGGPLFSDVEVTPCQKDCILRVVEDVKRFESMGVEISPFDWKSFFQTRTVDYQGDEVRIARSFCWQNIKLALPDEIGRVPLGNICAKGTKHFVEHIDDYIKPPSQWGAIKARKVMVADKDWEEVCQGLISSGICCVISREEVFHCGDEPLLNGLFAVTKDEIIDGVEVCRLIMNLIPFNSISQPLAGDIHTLLSWAMMGPLYLHPSECLLISSEDVRCFFYTMAVPQEWVKYLAFNKRIPDSVVPHGCQGHECYLSSRVLPMGYLNSVSIAQHVHRNLVMQLQSGRDGPGVNLPEQELRKDQPFSVADPRWRVYLDNYDLLWGQLHLKLNPSLKNISAGRYQGTLRSQCPGQCKLKFKERRWTVGKERPSLKKASYASTSLRPSTGSCK